MVKRADKDLSEFPGALSGPDGGYGMFTPSPGFPSTEEPEEEPDDVAVMNLLSELGENADCTVRIYRQGPGGIRDLIFLHEVGVGEFTPAMLQGEPFNGGTFRIHARSRGGLVANRVLKVAPRVEKSAPVSAPNSEIYTLLSSLAAQQNEFMRGIQNMLMQRQDESASEEKMLRKMGMYKELFSGGGSGAGMGEIIASVKDLLSLSKEMTPPALNDNGEIPGNAIIMKALEAFGPVLAQAAVGNKTVTSPVVLEGRQYNPIPASPAQHTIPDSENQPMNIIKHYLDMLCEKAERDSDAALYADLILDTMPDMELVELRGALDAPDWFDRFAAMNPRIGMHRAWFEKLRSEIIAGLTAMGGDDTTGAIMPGSPPDVSKGT